MGGVSGGSQGWTGQCLSDAVEEVDVVFLQGAHVGANLAKVARARFRAEAAGDFLLDLHHAHVAFGLRAGRRCHERGRKSLARAMETKASQ